MVETTDNREHMWSLFMWDCFIPFLVAIYGKIFTVDNMVCSWGTALGSAGGTVLMIPKDSISRQYWSHLYAIAHVICLSGSTVRNLVFSQI